MLREAHDRRQEMVDLLQTLVNMDSPSTDADKTNEITHFVGELCREMGAEVEYLSRPNVGDHVRASWYPEGVDSLDGGLLMLCHLDTVWPVGEAEKRPFKVEGDVATGPAVFDMKTGAVQAIMAVKMMVEAGTMPDRPITLLCNTDEENGSITSRPIIEELARKSSHVLVLEPSVPPGALKTFRKGVGRFDVTARGRASHSGADHAAGISAIEEMARQVLDLHAITDYETGTTVNVGVVEGGSRSNVVAERCTARVDLRVSSVEEGERVVEQILGLTPHLEGASVEVKGGLNRPPMERTEAIVAAFEKARELGADLGLEIEEAGTGGGSDGNFTAALGVPTLDGLGAVGAGGHAVDEWASVQGMVERTALLLRLLQEL